MNKEAKVRFEHLEMSDDIDISFSGHMSVVDASINLKEDEKRGICGYLVEVFQLATPMIGGLYLTMGVEVITLFFMGSLGSVEILAATGLATMAMNVCVMSILFGSIRGMETLVSQAFGKKDFDLMTAYFN